MDASSAIPRVFVGALRHFGISRVWLTVIAVLGFTSSVFAAVVPFLLGRVVDELALTVTGSEPTAAPRAVFVVLGALAVGMILRDALRIWYGYEVTRLTNELMVRARRDIGHRALSGLPRQGQDRRTDCTYMLSSDVPQLGALYAQPLTTVVSDVLDTVFMSVAIGSMSIALLGIVGVPLIPIFFIASWAGKRQRSLAVGIRQEESASSRLLDRAPRNSLVVQVFGGTRRELTAFGGRIDRLAAGLTASNRNLAVLMTSVGVLRLGATILAVGYAVVAVQQGHIPVGDIAALMMYLTRYYSPAVNLSKAYQGLQRGAVSTQRIIQFLSGSRVTNQPSHYPAEGPATLGVEEALVRLADGRHIRIPDFSIQHSGLVLLQGDSGAGKSSFLRALMGVDADALAGDVRVAGPMTGPVSGSVRLPFFSFAGQDNDLIGDTVRGAVVYPANLDDTDPAQGRDELRRVGIDGLADRRLDDDDTAPLSGGEARRLVLARALHRKAPILVADEVTSNLDADSQAAVEQALIDESRSRVVVLAAHGPSRRLIEAAAVHLTLAPEISL
ncbi:MAG: ABC transporter ATP-binding protein [Arachnia sp.]